MRERHLVSSAKRNNLVKRLLDGNVRKGHLQLVLRAEIEMEVSDQSVSDGGEVEGGGDLV